jgi:hypothetical protein
MTPFDSRFPFGLSPIANYEEISRRYGEAIPELAKEYSLPPALPARHPLLAQLEGQYAVQDQLPPWWSGCVDALTQQCPCLEPLLRSMSLQEFRRGSIEQQRWKLWRNASCQLSGEQQKPVACWRKQGPGLYKIMAEVLPAQNRALWLERFVRRGEKEIPADLDLVITADPAWWLNMGNGRGWYSCVGTGPDRDLRVIGNWYDTGVLLAALVARGADCWMPECLIARTTLRLVMDELPISDEDHDDNDGSGNVDESSPVPVPSVQRVVVGRIYHNDLTSACNLLAALATRFEQHNLYWGCIAGTNTAQFACDNLFGQLLLARAPHQTLGQAYWLPTGVERPALEGQVAYLEREEQESAGSWTYPTFGVHACHRYLPAATTRSHSNSRE